MTRRATSQGKAIASLLRPKPITYRHRETREVRVLKSLDLNGATYTTVSAAPAFNVRDSREEWERWIENAEEISR